MMPRGGCGDCEQRYKGKKKGKVRNGSVHWHARASHLKITTSFSDANEEMGGKQRQRRLSDEASLKEGGLGNFWVLIDATGAERRKTIAAD
jgi:hypothetical protein